MPTHRVRNAESSEWVIAAYVPGLELTVASMGDESVEVKESKSTGTKLGGLVRNFGRRSKGEADEGAAAGKGQQSTEPPDIVGLCDALLTIAFKSGASDMHIDPERNVTLVQNRVEGELVTVRKIPKNIHNSVISRFKV